MPTLNPSKPKKGLFQKSAVQAAVIGAVLSAVLGTASVIFLRATTSSPEQITQPPAAAASPPVQVPKSPPLIPPGHTASSIVPAASGGTKASKPTEQRTQTPKVNAAPLVEFDRPLQISELNPLTFRSLSATVSLEFRETLGTQYAELTISTPDQNPKRCAARNAGARCEFQTGETAAALDVVSVNQSHRTVEIILRNNSLH